MSKLQLIHPLWLRLTHWVNALAVVIMVMSGWAIYNAAPIFKFEFPDSITLGGWLGGALLWHFFAMWIVAVNGLIYLLMNALTGRFTRKYFPIAVKTVWLEFIAALKGRLSHKDLTHYNSLQKLAYLFMTLDVVLLVMSGLVVWKSVQFSVLRQLFGGYDQAREVHFFAMAALVAVVIVHLVMVALVPRTLVLMVRGR